MADLFLKPVTFSAVTPVFSIDHKRESVIQLRWAIYCHNKERLILKYTCERKRQIIVIR